MTLLLRIAVFAATTLLALPVMAATPSLELQSALAAARPGQDIPIVVTYRGKLSAQGLRKALAGEERGVRRRETVTRLRQTASSENAPILELATAKGARSVRVLWIANAVAMRASPDLVRALLEDPHVVQVRLDGQVEAPLPMVGEPFPVEWNLAMVRAPEVWQRGFRGEDVVIASLDTGVDVTHPDLAGSWRSGPGAWFDPNGEHAGPHDVSGHGTQVMGLLVGGSAGGSAIGVAPNARWIASKIFNDAGHASESAIHLAFQWVLDPDGDPATDDAPDVVNNSWGIVEEGGCNSAFQPDIDVLRAADIALVFSAGNFGPEPGTSVSPGNNAHVQSVGTVDSNRNVAMYSSRGPSACDGTIYPKLVAPGDNVLTSDLSLGGAPLYTLVSGSSFAAPHLSGVIALLRGASPQSSADDIETALIATAQDLGGAGPDHNSGYGLIDALAALDTLELSIDADGDGYAQHEDCNDANAAIHPGAAEIRSDRIDQDCNGYDLTIKVHHAVYSHDGTALRVRASSRLGAAAALEIVDMGPLSWRAPYRDWVLPEGTAIGTPRLRLTIRGVEGEVTVIPRKPTRRR